jgi:putative CRISPR-associated protein (TIGR02619 family)
MKKLLLIPVGTSLLEKIIKSEDETKSFNPEKLNKDYWETYKNTGHDGGKIEDVIEILSSYFIQEELDKRNGQSPYEYKNNPDRFSAEISSLLLFLNKEEKAIDINDTNIIKKNNFNYKIKLLISDTPQSKFCARVIQGYFNIKLSNLIEDVDLITICSLTEDGKKFNQGLKNLLTKINPLIKNGEYDEIIFNITSGFKGIIPYLTLAGMCYQNTKIIYLYETSPVIVPVPKLPVGFDIAGWNDNRAFLKTLQEVKGIYLDISQLPLSEEFKNLFEIENGKPILSSFGEFLSDEYERRKKEKSLSEFGRGYILADLIKDKDQKERLKKWINSSHFIWYGDNIPETRDHSRGHCQRLLELTAQIIKPYNIIFNNKSLLNDEELIILTLSIWFHDIGQSGREIIIPFNDDIVGNLLKGKWDNYKFYDISDFSEIVRDLHHILGFIKLIKNPEYYHFFDNYQDGFLPKKYLKAAALSYLYHRKSTPLNKESNYNFTYNCPDTEIKTSINKYQEVVNKLSFREKVDIEFITAIQTLVDECDNSKERTGDEEFIERRKAQTNSEILTEYKRLKYLSQGVNNYNDLLEYFKNNSGDWKDDSEILKIKASKEKIDDQSVEIIKSINQIISVNNLITNPAKNPILTEFIKCYEKIIFKLFQKSHFDKSGSVSSVFILPEKTNGGLKYKIVLETEYVNNNTYKPEVANKKGEQLNNACKDILFILQKVKTIFEKKGLHFEQNLFYKKEKSSIIQKINLD